jgi:hypothetical protein
MKRSSKSKSESSNEGISIRPDGGATLSRTQLDFNRLMKNLEATKTRYKREQAQLDEVLMISIRDLMPLIEGINRTNRDLIFMGRDACCNLKLTAKRRHWFGDLLSGKSADLLADPVGLTEEEIGRLQAVIDEFGPPESEQQMQEDEEEEFDFLRQMLEGAARAAGVEMDLSDLDLKGDPMELDRILRARLGDAAALFEGASSGAGKKRKPTKAQVEKERKRQEIEDAKNRDLKSLFKQLAKAFHPDLEPDPLLKEHKKVWMQRLNTAYADNDLREMLQLEMEWLGEEANNLATAGDEKLKIYCMVLKEQITELKTKVHRLKFEPQYSLLRRFIDPFYGTLANPISIKRKLHDELIRLQDMLGNLSRNDANARRMIHAWADEHAKASSR